jgi:hypothetical protein
VPVNDPSAVKTKLIGPMAAPWIQLPVRTSPESWASIVP